MALGVLLGSIGLFRIFLWQQLFGTYGPHWFPLGMTIGFALVGVVLTGTLSGSMLPFLLRRLGADPAASSTPFVATLVDVTAITAALGGAISIVKPGLYRRAMIRPLLVGLGHVEGPGPDPIRAGRVVDDVVRHLEWGIPVVIFPEGTRSPPGGLQPFGRVAFEIACRAQVPLVSLGITCAPVYLSKERGPFRPPTRTPELRIDVLSVDRPDGSTNSRALRADCEARYRAWTDEVADGTAGS